MKTIFKILLLALAALSIAAVVSFYYKKQVTAPAISFENVFLQDVDEMNGEIDAAADVTDLELVFKKALSRIGVFESESYLSGTQLKSAYSKFGTAFVPRFVDLSIEVFEGSAWPDKSLEYIKSQGETLLSGRKNKDSNILMTRDEPAVREVVSVVKSYLDAMGLSDKYNGNFNAARAMVSAARSYLEAPYLQNCTRLVDKMQNLPYRLNESHYRYLSNKVASLRAFRVFRSYEDYEQNAEKVYALLNEYDEGAYSVYGTKNDLSELKTSYQEYLSLAYDYWSSDYEYYY